MKQKIEKSGKRYDCCTLILHQMMRTVGYFTEQFKNDIRPDKKWLNPGTQYILTEDAEGKCNRSFKTFTTCVEHSNTGFTTQWGDNFGAQFKNKKIGGVFGEQMDFYNGKEVENV